MKKSFFSHSSIQKLCFLFLFFSFYSKLYSQTEYKVGVMLFKDNFTVDPNDPSGPYIGDELDQIVLSITQGYPVRQNSSRRVELVIELEVPWYDTQIGTGITPENYNFEWYQKFALICEQKNIKWTPLLSPHYVPSFFIDINSPYSYYNDKIKDYGNNLVTSDFLPLSPSSRVWDEKVTHWIKAFISEMQHDTNSIPGSILDHFATSITSSNAIEEMLVGNEMMYPHSPPPNQDPLTSYDDATRANWNSLYPLTGGLPTSLTPAFADFRSKQLSYCIVTMLRAAKQELSLRLGQPAAANIGLSSKLYPYFFPRTNNTFASIYDQYAGYSNSELGFINSESVKFLAMDTYTCPTGAWKIQDDYNAAKSRTTLTPTTSNVLYVSEYNRVPECIRLTENDVYNDGRNGFLNNKVRYFVFFAWNPDSSVPHWKITQQQKNGLRRLFDWVVPTCPTCTINRLEGQENNRDLSIAEITLNVNPNPVIDKVNINVTNIEEEFSFYIVNMFGQKIYEENNIKTQVSLDASIFESGVYTILIQTQSGDKLRSKFIKT